MAILNIRNLSDEVHRRLRIRAARKGRSMEAEARAILTEACSEENTNQPAATLPDWVDSLYGNKKPRNVVEWFISERRKESHER